MLSMMKLIVEVKWPCYKENIFIEREIYTSIIISYLKYLKVCETREILWYYQYTYFNKM